MPIKTVVKAFLLFSAVLSFAIVYPHFAGAAENRVVIVETSKGSITIELFEKKAPATVKNFLAYVKDGFYSDLIFHRVIPKFMIQGGGFDAKMNRKSTKSPIKNEAINKLSNKRGTVAMARSNVIDSATSQFFINLVHNDFLNHKDNSERGFGYAVFGKVIEGMDVVDRIGKVKTRKKRGMRDVPVKPVLVKNIRLLTPPSSPTSPAIH
ncbi:MAG: peptidyl-prolyl cis-trans isomerase [Deltaproteobacteria bacterium]|nr:peptidyl-prolyl cis-trans isomerase [Deltaproteobacteria bacterium]